MVVKHFEITCDGCNAWEFEGKRYKCKEKTCRTNFCSKCYNDKTKISKHSHKDFEEITTGPYTDIKEAEKNIETCKRVCLSYKFFKEVPPEVLKLKHLEELILSNNLLTALPEKFGELLPNLQLLNLNTNQLTALPEKIGEDLPNLQLLDLSENKLTALPEKFGKGLPNLQILYLGGNKLTALPEKFGEGLHNLQKLYLVENPLVSLPPSIAQCTKLSGKDKYGHQRLYFSNYPPSTLKTPPPEICKQGFDAVKAYFEAGAKKEIHRLKVLIVGTGGAGKTSIVENLFAKETEKGILTGDLKDTKGRRRTTIGVDVKLLVMILKGDGTKSSDIEFSLWDFGGQEDYYQTHSLFLSKRSLFILVVDINAYDCTQNHFTKHLQRWLDAIQAKVPNADVKIVLTKTDLCVDEEEKNDKIIDILDRLKKQEKKAVKMLKKQLRKLEHAQKNDKKKKNCG